jgi:hypothetical protein
MPRGLSTADKGKEQETIIILKTPININLSNSGSQTLNNQNRGNITLNNTQAKQPTIEQYQQLLKETLLLRQQLTK